MTAGNNATPPGWKSPLIKLFRRGALATFVAAFGMRVNRDAALVGATVTRWCKGPLCSEVKCQCHRTGLLSSNCASMVMTPTILSPTFWKCTFPLISAWATPHQMLRRNRETRIVYTQQTRNMLHYKTSHGDSRTKHNNRETLISMNITVGFHIDGRRKEENSTNAQAQELLVLVIPLASLHCFPSSVA